MRSRTLYFILKEIFAIITLMACYVSEPNLYKKVDQNPIISPLRRKSAKKRNTEFRGKKDTFDKEECERFRP